jgi:transposase-like protein
MSALRRKFTSEFKQEAVALVQRSGRSANQVAQELGVSQTALSHWLREATRAAYGTSDLRLVPPIRIERTTNGLGKRSHHPTPALYLESRVSMMESLSKRA